MAATENEILRWVFDVDFQVARLRALAGHAGYAGWWASRTQFLSGRTTRNGIEPLLERSSADYDQAPASKINSLPINIEQAGLLKLQTAMEGLATLSSDSRARRHACGSIAVALAILSGANSHSIEPLAQYAKTSGLFGLTQIDGLIPSLGGLSPIQAYVKVAFDAAPCTISDNITETFDYDADFESTTVALDFYVNRPVSAFARKFDPRVWDEEASDTFVQADQVFEAPPDPMVAPPPADENYENGEAGTSWTGLLYEDAQASYGAAILELKNLLNVDYQVADSQITLSYSLAEGLNVIVGDADANRGGLDRDSGNVSVTPKGNGSTHHTSSKSVRIAQPVEEQDLLNYDISVSLEYWFKNLVLLGVCEPDP